MIAGVLEIQMLANMARLQKDMQDAKHLIGSSVQSIERAVGGAKAALAALGLGVSVAGLVRFAQQAIQAQDEMVKLSQKVGVGVGALSQLAYAANLSGVSAQGLTAGMKGLSQRMLEANDSGSKAGKIFAALGVNLGGPTVDAIDTIADAFARLPDGTTKSALAVEIFGKSGMDMIPMLNQGSAGIRALREEADKLGLTMDQEAAKAAEQFNDNMAAVGATAQALGVSFVNAVAPAILEVSKVMKQATIDGGLLHGVLEGLREGWSQAFLGDPAKNRIAELRKELALLEPMLAEAPGLAGRVEELSRELSGLLSFQDLGRGAKPTASAGSGAGSELEKRLRAVFGSAKKAAEDVAAYNKRMRDLDNAGWVRHIDAMTAEYEDGLREQAKLSEDFYDEIERLRRLDDAGWVAYIEKMTRDYEDELLAQAGLTERYYEDLDRRFREQWGSTMNIVSSGFTQMFEGVLDGAINSWKDFARSLANIFKNVVVDFVGKAIQGVMNNVMNSLASGAGSFGNLLGGVNPLALAFAGGSIGGSLITGALGSGARGQQVGTLGGGAGATIGLALGGPIGAVAGAVIGSLIGHFTDPDGLAQRAATFGPTAGATGLTDYQYTSPFGTFGISDTSWFSDADMGGQLRQYFSDMSKWEGMIAGFLSSQEISAVTAALGGGSSRYGFGEEHGDFSATLGQITADRARTILNAVDPVLGAMVDAFEGTGEELGAFVVKLLGMRGALKEMNITGLDMATLQLMQRGGESIEDTFNRVAAQWAQFNQLFTTEAEQLTAAENLVTSTFQDLGIAIPATKEEFEALVRGLDLSTESGRKFFQALMQVAPAFAAVEDAAASMMQSFNAIMAQMRGPAYSTGVTQGLLQQSVQQFMGQNSWTAGMSWQQVAAAFSTITAEDFAAYSTANQQLILEILGYQQQLNDASSQAQDFTGAVGGATSALDAMASAVAQAKAGIRDWLDRIFLANTSPLTPAERLAFAESAYAVNLAKAQAGDAGALASFTQFADAYLKEAQAYWASSPEYRAIFEAVTGQASGLAGLEDTRPVTARDTRKATEDIVAALGDVERAITQLGEGQMRLSRTTEKVVAAVDTLGRKQTSAILDQTRVLATDLRV